ncbi:hypothetical protein AAHA92_10239 [Salvia divinorum]|uniref:Uncharacterized protein n=1 Tax=Salvia divinorum TaxID=28513 RepID=A0ABD1HUP7_SALDI
MKQTELILAVIWLGGAYIIGSSFICLVFKNCGCNIIENETLSSRKLKFGRVISNLRSIRPTNSGEYAELISHIGARIGSTTGERVCLRPYVQLGFVGLVPAAKGGAMLASTLTVITRLIVTRNNGNRSSRHARFMRPKSWPFWETWKCIFGKDRASGGGAEDVALVADKLQAQQAVGSQCNKNDYHPSFEDVLDDGFDPLADATDMNDTTSGNDGRQTSTNKSGS